MNDLGRPFGVPLLGIPERPIKGEAVRHPVVEQSIVNLAGLLQIPPHALTGMHPNGKGPRHAQ